MTTKELDERINELTGESGGLPADVREEIRRLIVEMFDHRKRLCVRMAMLHEALDNFRLKSLVVIHDLESTKRENAELRRKVEQLSGGSD